MTPCDEIRINLGGYVLDGLDADERTWVDEHLRDCADCRAELRELAELPGLLSLVAEAPPAPPAELRQRVVAQAPRRRPARRPIALLVAAALGLGLLLGVAVIPAAVQLGRPERLVTIELRPGEGFDARGSVSFARSGDRLQVDLALSGLPALPQDAVYEAWLAEPGADEPTSIGRFDPAGDGTAEVRLVADGSLEDYEGVWVTAEPDASSPSHDGPTVVAAAFPGSEESWPGH